jgi:hypothetical protein
MILELKLYEYIANNVAEQSHLHDKNLHDKLLKIEMILQEKLLIMLDVYNKLAIHIHN